MEVLVSLMILLVGVLTVVTLFPRGFSLAYKSRERMIAYDLGMAMLQKTLQDPTFFTQSASGVGYASASDYKRFELADFIYNISTQEDFDKTGYGNYWYRIQMLNIADPNLLYNDQITRRVTVYVTVPPTNPQVHFAGIDFENSEADFISKGKVVVLSALKTNRKTAVQLAQNVYRGDQVIYSTDSDMPYIFPRITTASDGEDTNSWGEPDIDYDSGYGISYYTKSVTISGTTYKPTYTKFYDISSWPLGLTYLQSLQAIYSDDYSAWQDNYELKDVYVAQQMYNNGTESFYCDPAVLGISISYAYSVTEIHAEANQVIGGGYDSSLGYYYLRLKNPIQWPPPDLGYYPAGSTYARAYIYYNTP